MESRRVLSRSSPTTTTGPSEPQAPIQRCIVKPLPVERLTVQLLSLSRHMKTSVFPSPLRSPTKTGPSEPQAPVQRCMANPLPVERLTVQLLSLSRHITTSVFPSPLSTPTMTDPTAPQAPDHP